MKDAIWAGKWDFAGGCAPPETGGKAAWAGQLTFTLGCFQWEANSSRNGFKKGRIQKRIKGCTSDPAPAYEAARAYCRERNTAPPPAEGDA